MSTVVTLIIRHLLTALGGFLFDKGVDGGVTTQVDFTEGLVGAGLFIAGVVWSIFHKKKTGELPKKG